MAAVYDCRRHIIVVRVIAYNRMTTGKELHQYSERCPYEARAHRVLGVFVFTELLLLLLSYLLPKRLIVLRAREFTGATRVLESCYNMSTWHDVDITITYYFIRPVVPQWSPRDVSSRRSSPTRAVDAPSANKMFRVGIYIELAAVSTKRFFAADCCARSERTTTVCNTRKRVPNYRARTNEFRASFRICRSRVVDFLSARGTRKTPPRHFASSF